MKLPSYGRVYRIRFPAFQGFIQDIFLGRGGGGGGGGGGEEFRKEVGATHLFDHTHILLKPHPFD